jgi:purine-binding chemotaxis protein CheW
MSSPAGIFAKDQAKDASGGSSQYMSFIINGCAYAIPLSQVAEITPYRQLNLMPHMPESVEGLLDLRGHVLPVICLRTRMHLPKKETNVNDSILLIDHEGSRLGFLVDQVESVITTTPEQQMPVSLLLEGQDGVWVREILLLNGKVVLVLEPASLVRISQGNAAKVTDQKVLDIQVDDDVEEKLDEGLRSLIAMAKPAQDSGRVGPQIQSLVSRTETEVAKVLECVESMLADTDHVFTGVGRFRQEVAIEGLKGYDENLTELDQVAQDLQSNVFDVIQQLQFQDIVRQKLERVMRHIAGMHMVISDGFGCHTRT